MKIKFKKLDQKAVVPGYARAGDAGFDLHSVEEKELEPGERHAFSTGLASEFSQGYFIRLAPKSGLALKAGLDVLAGVIDAGYRGEWKVIVINHGPVPYRVQVGDKIAQALLMRVETAVIKESSKLSATERGQGGFGSTGKR